MDFVVGLPLMRGFNGRPVSNGQAFQTCDSPTRKRHIYSRRFESQKYLDSQKDGAAFMLSRTFGFVLINSQLKGGADVSKAAALLKSVYINEGIIVNIMRLDKIFTALLFLSILVMYDSHMSMSNPVFQPSLMICPVPFGDVFP